jgi:hypothetical protein
MYADTFQLPLLQSRLPEPTRCMILGAWRRPESHLGPSQVAKPDAPFGWEKVQSRSRPGQFSFKHLKSGDVYDSVPSWAWIEEAEQA